MGFVNIDGAGIEGIEKSFDDVLRGRPIPVCQLRDGGRKPLWLNSAAPPAPAESCGVKLTLDASIEYVAECELEKAAHTYRAKGGEVVVMDAGTGEVLAMTSRPFSTRTLFRKKRDSKEDFGRNHAISDSFEPGSTFKVFLMSAALDQDSVREHDRVYCEGGKCLLAGHSIKDVHPDGWLTMQEVIKYSSNIGAAKIALRFGSEKFARYINEFGFGSVSGIDLPGRIEGACETAKEVETDRPGHNRLWTKHWSYKPSAHQRRCGDSLRRAIRPADYRQHCVGRRGTTGQAIPVAQNTNGNSKEDIRTDSCYDGVGN